jgi:hypothetical protein
VTATELIGSKLWMDYTLEQRRKVHEYFEETLRDLDAQDREPDRWEEDALVNALGVMACDMYALAKVEIDMARTAPGERSRESMARLNATPREFTKARLRRGLMCIRAFEP